MSLVAVQSPVSSAPPLPARRLIAMEWLLIAEELRRELRRFPFTARELRTLDVVIAYSLCRGSMSAQIPRVDLMRLARLDDSALSKVLAGLRAANVLKVSENVSRESRARCQKGDCPSLEILLESKCWFGSIGAGQEGSDGSRKHLERTEPEEANLIHNGLCEVNPVQVDLPPMGLPEAYALVVQDCERERLAARGRDTASLANREKASAVACAGSDSGAAPAPRANGKKESPWIRAIDADPEERLRLALEAEARVRAEGVVKKTTAPREAVVKKTSALGLAPGEQLSKKQLPGADGSEVVENEGKSGVLGAVVKKTNAATSDGLRPSFSTLKALKDCKSSNPLKPLKGEYEGAGTDAAAEAVVKKTTASIAMDGPAPILLHAADFVGRLYKLMLRARDQKTLASWKSYSSWWRFAFLVSPDAANEAANDLQLRLDSTLPLDKPGGWTRGKYWKFGGQWVGRDSATPEQKSRLQALGVRFYDQPFVMGK